MLRKVWLILSLAMCANLLPAQDRYYVKLESNSVKLYLGYRNAVRILLNTPDTLSYLLQAHADGAVIDYDSGRMDILPTRKTGSVTFFAERAGILYEVKGKLEFDAVPPPSGMDDSFIRIMGITKDDPKTFIAHPKQFAVPAAEQLKDIGITLMGFPLGTLTAGQPSRVKVVVLTRGEVYMTPASGNVELASGDGQITKSSANEFTITPDPAATSFVTEVKFNGTKISEERLLVLSEEGAVSLKELPVAQESQDSTIRLLGKLKAYRTGKLASKIVTPSDTAKAHQYFTKALTLQKKKKYEEALSEWEKAIAEYDRLDCVPRVAECIIAGTLDRFHTRDETGTRDFSELDAVLELARAVYPDNSADLEFSFSQAGTLFLAGNEFLRAVGAFKNALLMARRRSIPGRLRELDRKLGMSLMGAGDPFQAIEYLEQALKMFTAHDPEFGDILKDLSACYFEWNDFSVSRENLFRYRTLARTAPQKAWYHYMNGKILLAMHQPDSAYASCRAAFRSLPERHFAVAFNEYRNHQINPAIRRGSRAGDDLDLRMKILLALLATSERMDTVILRESEAILFWPPLMGRLSNRVRMESVNSMGNLSTELLRVNPSFYRGWYQSWSWNETADTAQLTPELLAIELFNWSIRLNFLNNLNAANDYHIDQQLNHRPLGLPGAQQIDGYQNAQYLLDAFFGKARADYRLFEVSGDSAWLSEALSNIQTCDSILQRSKNTISQKTRMKMTETGAAIYELGTHISYLFSADRKYMDNTLFAFVEKGKSGMLRDNLNNIKAELYSGIPDSLVAQEHLLATQAADAERSLAVELSRRQVRQPVRDSLKSHLLDLSLLQEKLSAQLARVRPGYKRRQKQEAPLSLWDVSDALRRGEALVEFQWGEKHLTIVLVDSAGWKFIELPADTMIEKHIRHLRNGIIQQSKSDLMASSHWLYQHIFQAADAWLSGRGISKLILVTDGILGYVPFEVLTTTSGGSGYATMPYLIRKYELRYALSASLYFNNLNVYGIGKQSSGMVAFAPVFPDSRKTNFLINTNIHLAEGVGESEKTRAFSADGQHIMPLPATESEVRSLVGEMQRKNLFAKYFLFRAAREKELKSDSMVNYKYIHLATHGIINERFPEASGLLLMGDSLSAEDGILYSGEIFGLKLNADLVVLSACETGLGKVVKGEGIMGLTRGWLFAGAKGVVVSLWKVADESTSEFMISFYNELLSGSNVPASLRHAKLEMIAGQKYADPYYWGPFIEIGVKGK